ncbi:MAG: PepSY domain-containing protein [Burkholderiales bacterium]|nr:PepSY domain-containing protein [Burkholderiales bacterium]
MKLGTPAFTLLMLSSAGAFAATLPAGGPAIPLDEAVRALESRYPGKVVAIALDDSGDKAAHYHVDMRFPESGLARVDVDAATLEIGSRDAATPTLGLLHAVARAASAVDAPLLAAHLDAASGASAHYDVDVRLPDGWLGRLKVDAATGQIGWRTPAIVAQ